MTSEEYEELREEWETLQSEGCLCSEINECEYCITEAYLELEEFVELHSPGW